MKAGDFEAAWQQTDRLEIPRRKQQKEAAFQPEPYHLRWSGESWENRRVLIRCLHGLGDTIQFIRYLPLLRKTAAETYVMAQPDLVSLLSSTSELGPVLDGWTDALGPTHDIEMEIMELPYIFRTRTDTLPDKVPYFDTNAIRKLKRIRIPDTKPGKIRVGLIWAASQWDTSRSLPIECMEEWKNVTNVEWFCLQQGLENRVAQPYIRMHSLADQTQEVTQAAAAMLELDLVISVDTLTAHLAGALGCPIWLMLSHQPDWRWLSFEASSRWYPTMRIFRCLTPEGWRAMARKIAEALSFYAVV